MKRNKSKNQMIKPTKDKANADELIKKNDFKTDKKILAKTVVSMPKGIRL